MELYFKLFEVLSPVFFIVGIGYFLGKKKSDIDTTFITNYSANFGAPALFIFAITSSGVVTATGLTIGSAAIVEAELEMLDTITAGTVAASKAVVVDANKDIASFIRSASGHMVPKNGSHINAWVHLQDIVQGIDFAYQQRLHGVFNLVDDLQVSRRDLSNLLCDDEGLAPVIWENHDRSDARIFNARVSNEKLKQLGFQPSVRSMLDPVAAI